MKSLISIVVAIAVLASGLLAAPETTRAQTSGESEPAPGAPTDPQPAASPAPETAAQPVPTPSADEDALPEDPTLDEVVVREERDDDPRWWDRDERGFWSGQGRNIAFVLNRSDGKMRFRSRVRLVHIKGDRAEPVNAAFAYSSCTDCQSFAVALEIALISPNASVVAPQNRARAINYECTRCVTVARALQYVYAIEDPDQVPDNVRRLMNEMERELREIGRDRSLSPGQANERVNAVIAQFQELNASLQDDLARTEEVTSPGATPADALPAEPAAAPPTEPAPDPMPSPAPTAP